MQVGGADTANRGGWGGARECHCDLNFRNLILGEE